MSLFNTHYLMTTCLTRKFKVCYLLCQTNIEMVNDLPERVFVVTGYWMFNVIFQVWSIWVGYRYDMWLLSSMMCVEKWTCEDEIAHSFYPARCLRGVFFIFFPPKIRTYIFMSCLHLYTFFFLVLFLYTICTWLTS